MKWNEFVEQADELLLARQLNEYMGIEYEKPKPTREHLAPAAAQPHARAARRRGTAR